MEGEIQTMDNPGLKKHTSTEPFLKVIRRRTATALPVPRTLGTGGYGVPPEPATLKENVETAPPMAGTPHALPVPATNGAEAVSPVAVNLGAEQRRITQQQQVGGGTKENPAYDDAQDQIREKMQVRRDRTSALYPVDRPALNELGLEVHRDSDFPGGREDRFQAQPMFDLKEIHDRGNEDDLDYYPDLDASAHLRADGGGCETCWLRNRNDYHHPDAHHEHKPFADTGRYSSVQRASALYPTERPNLEELGLRAFQDSDFHPGAGNPSRQPMMDLKDVYDGTASDHGWDAAASASFAPGGCQTCWLQGGDTAHDPDLEQDHEKKPFSMGPGERYSSVLAAQVPHDDPVFPYNPQANPEHDTADLDNLQSGDDTFRPHHPDVDRVMNHLQGLPDMSNPHSHLLDQVNNILDEGPDTEEHQRGSDALASGLNTIFDSMKESEGLSPAERLQRGKDAIDAHFETSRMSLKDHVKRLQEDWKSRGGRKTGEPIPVEKFSPKYKHPDGQYLVSDPDNPFPQSESVIRYKGDCKGCGTSLFMDDAGDMTDPRGAIGDHTPDNMRAQDYDMHGPEIPACFNCTNDSDRYHSLLDKGKGYKEGDKTGGFHWTWQTQPDGTRKNVRIDHTHYKDKKGKWHQPGEQTGSCPDCGPGEQIDQKTGSLATGIGRSPGRHQVTSTRYDNRVLTHPLYQAHHEPMQDIKDTLAIQGESGNWDSDPYMHGMFNGMELQNSIVEGRDPEFRDAPEHWGFEKASGIGSLSTGIDVFPGRHQASNAKRASLALSKIKHPLHQASWDVEDDDDPRRGLEDLIKGLPEPKKEVLPWTMPTHQQWSDLASLGFERHEDEDTGQPYWLKNHNGTGYMIGPSREEPRGGHWETSVGPENHWAEDATEPVEPMFHVDYQNALQRMKDPDGWYIEHMRPQEEMFDGVARPGKMKPFVPRARPANPGLISLNSERVMRREAADLWTEVNALATPYEDLLDRVRLRPLHKQAETDEEFWARMEQEHPGQQSTDSYLHSDDAATLEHEDEPYRDPDVDWDDDDLDIPQNMSLRDHAKLLRSGIMRWDGGLRYPEYTHNVHREIRDSDGNPAYADESHVIQHNTRSTGPVLPTDDHDEPAPHPLQYPWTHTYYPAGQSSDEGLVKGYNTVDQALNATNHLSIYGARKSTSQDLLKGYQYVGSELPYNPAEELPHEAAMRQPRQPNRPRLEDVDAFTPRHAGFKDDFKDAFTDFTDWTADKYWTLGIPGLMKNMHQQLKSVQHPDMYNEHGELAEEGYQPKPWPAGVKWKDIASKPRHVEKPAENPGARRFAANDPQYENNRTCGYYVRCTNPAVADYHHPVHGVAIPTCDEHGEKKGIKGSENWHPYPEGD